MMIYRNMVLLAGLIFMLFNCCFGINDGDILDETALNNLRLRRSAETVQRDCQPAKTWDSKLKSVCYRQVATFEIKRSGGGWWKRTNYHNITKYKTESFCCQGYKNTSVSSSSSSGWLNFFRHYRFFQCMPMCHGRVSLSSCNSIEGEVKPKQGEVIRCSGGECIKPNVCKNCNTGYYADNSVGQCKACKRIDHCNIPKCSDGKSSTCDWCDGDIQPKPGWRAYTNHLSKSQCQRACSWRDGARCFPGNCSGEMIYPTDCKCAPGFTGTNCATFLKSDNDIINPKIIDFGITLRGTNTPLLLPNTNFPDRQQWTKINDWSSVDVVAKSVFITSWTVPEYIDINNTKIGIDTLDVKAVLKRGTKFSTWDLHQTCNFKPSGCNITRGNVTFQGIAWNNILQGGYPTPFAHLDLITITVSTSNGGKVYYYDREHNDTKSYKISGITVTKTFLLGFDMYQPGHCFELATKCKEQPLVTPDFVRKSTFLVSWGGWSDNDSGLHVYIFNIMPLKVKDTSVKEPVLESTNTIVFEKEVNASEDFTRLNVTTPGPYFVEMAATDWAGNKKLTRRIFIFDDQSKVDLQGESPIVKTASEESGYKWINSNASRIHIIWPGRFINKRHFDNSWLNAVAECNVSRDLEDIGNTSARSTSKIPNIQGVVKYTIGYTVTYGMNTSVVTKDFVTVPQDYFDDQNMYIKEDFVDGKQITFMIRGYDVMNEYAEDNVTVTIDMSPPIIQNLWLTKGDILNVSVHNVQELDKLTLEWEVYDLQSGLDSIQWKLFDNYTKHVIVHGNGHEIAQGDTQTLDECNLKYSTYPRRTKCYCTPFDGCFNQHFQLKPKVTITGDDGLHVGKETGLHESDYFVEVTAINKASLMTVRTLKITIDTSPPHQGVVHDGLDGQPEVDFQQSLSLNSHWSGFFDKESGVWFYMYSYGTSCLYSSDFDVDSMAVKNLTKTYAPYGHFTAINPGKYYVTVVAYNHALDHSIPVCSDGVTVDSSDADITEIVVEGAVTHAGLIKDDNNTVYVLYENRQIEEILSPSSACIMKATQMQPDVILTFPVTRYVNGSRRHVLTTAVCEDMPGVDAHVMSFVITDSHLDVSWNVTHGLSSIHDFQVGLASHIEGIPDKMKFVSTKQHQHFRIIHPDVWDGEEFYVLVEAITKAAVESLKVVGPFAVDTTKPEINGNIDVLLEKDGNTNYLVARWPSRMFEDHGDPSPLKYEVALGTKKNGRNILSFQPLSPGATCTIPMSCTAINVNSLPWRLHGNQNYFVTVKATNTIGLHASASSEAYTHDVELASKGIVFDVDVDTNSRKTLQDIEDIDFQTRTDILSVRWSGFHHPHLDITFYVCIYSANITLNTTCEAANAYNEHTFINIHLIPYMTYYQEVIAHTDVGNVTVKSDGITIVIEDDVLPGIIVYDGVRCLKHLDNSFVNETGHHSEDKRLLCHNEIGYQTSTNKLNAYWIVPDAVKRFAPDVYWSIEKRAPVAEHWTRYSDFVHHKTSNRIHANNLFLEEGRRYRISIKLCATVYCFHPIKSNGVTIVPNPPVGNGNTLIITESNTTETIHIQFNEFYDSDIEDFNEARDVMDHYEWAFTDNSHHGRLLTKWQRVDVVMDAAGKNSFDIALVKKIAFTKCWRVSIRGYTKAGLSSVISSEIRKCSDIQQVRPGVVLDVVGQVVNSAGSKGVIHVGQPISLQENNKWTDTDMDYTPYNNIISAVWPTLRYNTYVWAVLNVEEEDPSVFYKTNTSDILDPCAHPDAVKCGVTDTEYMNALFEKDELIHGRRFMVCIHANETQNIYEKWSETLESVSVCSDGITIDLTPPVPQTVWIGSNIGDKFQTSSSDMSVNWKSFIDVEEQGHHVHSSGISNYQIALGTSYKGVDTVQFTDVGLTNHHIFHGLKLQNGHSYFATVRALDFTNQSSESVTPAVKVDITPPNISTSPITIDKRHITDTSSVSACWEGVFVDKESGISHYLWAVGTQPGYEDAMNFTQTDIECAETDIDAPLSLLEGHGYFVSVKAYNNAGLFATAVSWAFIVDASPPTKGDVYDGPRNKDGSLHDIDYLTNSTVLEAHWTDFHEQHGSMKEYFIHVGSCKTCDDILIRQPIGITQDIVLEMLHLVEGLVYYVTVTACNTVDMCTSATSDGVIIDRSPPSAGQVLDGIDGEDIQYQTSRIYIGAQWYGFSDPQSEISHYVWRVGTSVGGDDILAATDVHISEEAFIIDLSLISGKSLPVGIRIFPTVRAYNKAGMFSEATSNGFIVDETPPIFKTPLSHVQIGSIFQNTTILKSVFRIKWTVEDKQSFIDAQYLSISSHMGGDFNLSSMKVDGIVRDYTFTGLDLHDGSVYCINLVTCNGAKLCTESILRKILVDSSQPTPGMFAIDTDHAANLKREPATWMTWTTLGIRLAWLGFEDEHSGITKYMVNFGSTFMGNDLNKVSGEPVVVMHNTSGEQNEEGVIQIKEVDTKSLAKYKNVFISIWAENGVGLSSPIIHAEFELVFGGLMELVRRCSAYTCYGHCVCAPYGGTCHTDAVCKDVSTSNGNNIVDVQDYIDLTFPENNPLITCKHSPIKSMVAAQWTAKGMHPLWYEMSVGLHLHDTPKGVFNQADSRVWHTVGQSMRWVMALSSHHLLQEKHRYSFFIRAWYDRNTYAIFKSAGLLIYSTPPKSILIQGRRVKETTADDEKDKDYIDKNMQIYVNWKGKFVNTENSLLRYHLYIGSHRGGHDAHVLGTDISPTVTRFNITGLDFAENTWYYSVVQAYNHAGLHTTVSSDGFMIDSSPPSPGTVCDGEGFHDVHALNSSISIPSFWYGFTDDESGIKSYDVCIYSNDGPGPCNIHDWTQVGIATHTSIKQNYSVVDGTILYSKVRATDAVGHKSEIVKSNGVIIDTSPPTRGSDVSYGNNILKNPSFETSEHTHTIKHLTNITECESTPPNGWHTLLDETCILTVKAGHEDVLPNGNNFIIINGNLTQDVQDMKGLRKYRLTFFTSHVPTEKSMISSNEGFVEVNKIRHIFLLYNKPRNRDATNYEMGWHKHTFFFEIYAENITITIATLGRTTNFALDNVKLQRISVSDDRTSVDRRGHVKAHTVFIHDWSSIHANWNFLDEECTIVEYLWAIGTIEGGTQMQDFISVGRRTFAYTYSLHLVHDTSVFVTVVAVNVAGLRSVSYSDPIVIDLTPPEFTFVYDGPVPGEDIDYQQHNLVSVNWNVKDGESGMKSCKWAIGVRPGDTSLQDYTRVHTDIQTANTSISLTDLPDRMIYVSLKCKNNAGLTSHATTDGVMIITTPPSSDDVLLEILTRSKTQYPVHGVYHGDSTTVKLRWTGFRNDEGIDSYLVTLGGDNTHVEELVEGKAVGFTYVSFTNLHLLDGNYTATVTAVNHMQMYSQRKYKTFYMLNQPPHLTDTPIIVHWTRTKKILHSSWRHVFTSEHPMYFEVTVSQVDGGDGDLIQWQETTETTLDVLLDTEKMAGSQLDIEVSVRAISHCGLFKTAHAEILIDI